MPLFYFAWTFRIIPYANNFYVQDRTEYLTGKKFWSQKEFIFESMSVRGESYVFEVYKFNDETSEFFEQSDSLFFAEFPPDNMTDIRWTRTPIEKSEKEILEFVLSFHNSQDKELMKWQNIIREEAYKSRSYYSYSQRVIRQKTYFYIIIPEMNYIGIIYLNT